MAGGPASRNGFRTTRGRNYVILVGSKNRCYIAKDTLEDEAASQVEGVLSIGRIEGDTIHVFLGSLRPLADKMDDLLPPHSQDAVGFYRFMYEENPPWQAAPGRERRSCRTRRLPGPHADVAGEGRRSLKTKAALPWEGRRPNCLPLCLTVQSLLIAEKKEGQKALPKRRWKRISASG